MRHFTEKGSFEKKQAKKTPKIVNEIRLYSSRLIKVVFFFFGGGVLAGHFFAKTAHMSATNINLDF
jgi:hypothetical protein